MGDRGNIGIAQGDGVTIYFYTHWNGSDVVPILQNALRRRERWSDPAYLARIIFDELTRGQQGWETGFGISTSVQDNEHPIPMVDCFNQRVEYAGKVYTFPEFIALLIPSEEWGDDSA